MKTNVDNSWIDFLLDLIYPPICMICGQKYKIDDSSRYICDECIDLFKFKQQTQINSCVKCGRELESGLMCKMCYSYIKEDYFIKNYSIFVYDDVIRRSIYSFKYGSNTYYKKVFVKLFSIWLEENKDVICGYDCIVPIPMYKKKENARGFNQAKLIAKEFNKVIATQYDDTSLYRIKKTTVQSGLNPDERFNNLKDAFVVKGDNLKNKNVILIDDIYTTGSTIYECSKVLKNAGVLNIISITLSIVEN